MLLPFAPTKARARVVVSVSVVVSVVSVSVSVSVRVGCFFLAQSFCIGRRRSAFVEPFVLCVLFFCTYPFAVSLSLSLSAAPFSIMVPLNVRVKPLTEERHHHHQTKLPLLPSS